MQESTYRFTDAIAKSETVFATTLRDYKYFDQIENFVCADNIKDIQKWIHNLFTFYILFFSQLFRKWMQILNQWADGHRMNRIFAMKIELHVSRETLTFHNVQNWIRIESEINELRGFYSRHGGRWHCHKLKRFCLTATRRQISVHLKT